MKNERLPRTIDPISMAEHRLFFEGTLPLSEMKRLIVDFFPGKELGEVSVWLEGGIDSQGIPYLHGKAETEVPLQCQRCLKSMSYNLKTEFYLVPVKNEEKVNDLPESYEALIYHSEKISLSELIEDELLLLLPIVPKHPEKDCTIVLPSEGNMVNSAPQKFNPFAKLAELNEKQEVK